MVCEVSPKCLFGWVGVISPTCAPVPERSLLDDFSDSGLARDNLKRKRPFLASASVLQA